MVPGAEKQMTALLSLVLKNWKLVAIGGLVLALVTGWGVHRVIVSGMESDLAGARQELAVCEGNLAAMNAALEAQNAAVEALREKAAASQREADRRAQEARERASRDRRREAADDRSGPERMNQFMSEVFQ